MELIRIQIAVIILLCSGFNHCYAGDTGPTDTLYTNFIRNTVTETGEPYKYPEKGKFCYILITSKNCSRCFEKACQLLKQEKYKDYQPIILITTKYDLLSLLPLSSHYSDLITCSQATLFHFTDDKAYDFIYEHPSPQLILRTDNKTEYLPYNDTIQLIDH